MRTELAVAIVAGLFGLVPLMVQIVSTRAQRRDRMTRLNQLRAELELLERFHTLQGEVSATDEATKPQTNVFIRDALSKVLEQYNKLSEIPPSTVEGGKSPPPRQLSFLRRALLLYTPHTTSGWILHTLFYIFAITPVTFELLVVLTGGLQPGSLSGKAAEVTINVLVLLVPAVIVRYLARRNAVRKAAPLEEPDA